MLLLKVLLVLLLPLFSQANDNDAVVVDPVGDLRRLAEQATVDCYENDEKTVKINVEPDGFNGLLTAEMPPNRNTKCIRHCIMRKNQLLDEDHHLDEAGMLKFLANAYINNGDNDANNNNNGNKEHKDDKNINAEVLKRTINECKTQASNETDRCERSHLASTCILSKLNESH